MRHTARRLARLVAATALVAGAQLAQAGELPVRVTLALELPNLPPLPVEAPGVVQLGTLGGGSHLLTLRIPAGFASRASVTPITDTAVNPIQGLQFTLSNGPGTFFESGAGRFRGLMPLSGAAKVCLFGTCSNALANLTVPLGVIGRGGSVAVAGLVNVTVQGAPWTTGAIPNASPPASGSREGPAGARSSTAQIGGDLAMVTPIFISTSIGAFARIDAVGRLSMSFDGVPGCDVEVDRSVYRDGQTVVLSRLHLVNQRAAGGDYRFRVLFVVPIGGGLVVSALDRVVRLPSRFDQDLGPVATVPVQAQLPRGAYAVRCSLTDTVSGEEFGDEAGFAFE